MSLNKPAYRPLKEKVSITLDMDVVEALRRRIRGASASISTAYYGSRSTAIKNSEIKR